MRKTPLQEFEDKFFEHSSITDYKCPEGRQYEMIDLETLGWLFDEFIKKEKEVIKEAYIEASPNFGDITKDEAEDYYNETFNTKEK